MQQSSSQDKLRSKIKKVAFLRQTVNQIKIGDENVRLRNIFNVLQKDVSQRTAQEIVYLERNLATQFDYFLKLQQQFDQEKYQEIFKEITGEKFEANQVVFEMGDVGRKMYFLISGKLAVLTKQKQGQSSVKTKNEQFDLMVQKNFPEMYISRELKKGSYFGEISLQHRIPRTATIISTEESYCAVLTFETFNRLIGQAVDSGFVQQVEFLKTLVPFQEWGALPMTLIQHHLKKRSFRPQQVVYEEDSNDGNIYFIEEGEVSLRKMSQRLGVKQALVSFTRGSHFGDQEFIFALKDREDLSLPNDFKVVRRMQAVCVVNTQLLVANFAEYVALGLQYQLPQLKQFLSGTHHPYLNIREIQICSQNKEEEDKFRKESLKIDIRQITSDYLNAQPDDQIRQFVPETSKSYINKVVKSSSKDNPKSDMERFLKEKNIDVKNFTDFNVDLLEKFSHAIPFREDPYNNSIKTIRSARSASKRTLGTSQDSRGSSKDAKFRYNIQIDNEKDLMELVNTPGKFCDLDALKIYLINRREQILLYKRLQTKCNIKFPYDDEIKKYRIHRLNIKKNEFIPPAKTERISADIDHPLVIQTVSNKISPSISFFNTNTYRQASKLQSRVEDFATESQTKEMVQKQNFLDQPSDSHRSQICFLNTTREKSQSNSVTTTFQKKPIIKPMRRQMPDVPYKFLLRAGYT